MTTSPETAESTETAAQSVLHLASGATRLVETARIEDLDVRGIDEEGRVVVSIFDHLFGLTLCCDAFDKGGDDDSYCRGCWGAKPDADQGRYLFDGDPVFDALVSVHAV